MISLNIPRIVSLLVVAISLGTTGQADSFDSYIKYEYLPEEGKIVISDNHVTGREKVLALEENREELVKEGIFSGHSEEPPIWHTMTDTLGEHVVKTLITLFPPIWSGYGGANDTATVEIWVDGKKKISCHIGYYAPLRQIVNSITVAPEDGLIYVSAVDEHGQPLGTKEGILSISDPRKFRDKHFLFPDEPEREDTSEADEELILAIKAQAKEEVIEYLESRGGIATVEDVVANTSNMFDHGTKVAIYKLRDEGKLAVSYTDYDGLKPETVVWRILEDGTILHEGSRGNSDVYMALAQHALSQGDQVAAGKYYEKARDRDDPDATEEPESVPDTPEAFEQEIAQWLEEFDRMSPEQRLQTIKEMSDEEKEIFLASLPEHIVARLDRAEKKGDKEEFLRILTEFPLFPILRHGQSVNSGVEYWIKKNLPEECRKTNLDAEAARACADEHFAFDGLPITPGNNSRPQHMAIGYGRSGCRDQSNGCHGK